MSAFCENVIAPLYVMVVCAASPRLVVTRITPFAPFTPYTAAEAASLRIVMFAISDGSRFEKSRSTPSTSTSGEDEPVVETPRMYISAWFSPGRPDVCLETRPGSLPPSMLDTLSVGAFVRASVLTEATEPVMVPFFCTP